MTTTERLLQEQIDMLVRECSQHRDTIQMLTQSLTDARVERDELRRWKNAVPVDTIKRWWASEMWTMSADDANRRIAEMDAWLAVLDNPQ